MRSKHLALALANHMSWSKLLPLPVLQFPHLLVGQANELSQRCLSALTFHQSMNPLDSSWISFDVRLGWPVTRPARARPGLEVGSFLLGLWGLIYGHDLVLGWHLRAAREVRTHRH